MKRINFYEFGSDEIYVTIYFDEKDHYALNKILNEFKDYEYEVIKEEEYEQEKNNKK